MVSWIRASITRICSITRGRHQPSWYISNSEPHCGLGSPRGTLRITQSGPGFTSPRTRSQNHWLASHFTPSGIRKSGCRGYLSNFPFNSYFRFLGVKQAIYMGV